MSASLVSIILPVYNQADHVEKVVASYQTALERLPAPYELLLVVNGSLDGSLEICRSMEGTADPGRLRTLASAEPGWGRAVLLGLQAAQGDLISYTNLARTSAEELTLVLLYALVHPDVVVKANRKIRDSAYRRLGSLLYNLECRALFDLSYWDINGTPKAFPRALDKLLSLSRTDDLIDVEFNVICRRESYRVLEVPILASTRHGGRSTTNHRSALRMYWGAFQMWRREKARAP